MSATCPVCRSAIATADINVSTDLALCRGCGRSLRYSEIAMESGPGGPDLNAPPSGAWFEPLADGFTVGATTRTWQAAFLIPFTCVWSGFSMTTIYGSQIAKGHFNPGSSLFGLPFLLGSCVLVSMCALYTAGKVVVTQRGDGISIFTGVGWLGRTRQFAWTDFTAVREDFAGRGDSRNGSGRAIVLEGTRRVAFGTLLSDERRYFLVHAIRKFLNQGGGFDGSMTAGGRFR